MRRIIVRKLLPPPERPRLKTEDGKMITTEDERPIAVENTNG
jgi:hypothetical protein